MIQVIALGRNSVKMELLLAIICVVTGFVVGVFWERGKRAHELSGEASVCCPKANISTERDITDVHTQTGKAFGKVADKEKLKGSYLENGDLASETENRERSEVVGKDEASATVERCFDNDNAADSAADQEGSGVQNVSKAARLTSPLTSGVDKDGSSALLQALESLLERFKQPGLFWVSETRDPLTRQYSSPGWRKLMGPVEKEQRQWLNEVHSSDVDECKKVSLRFFEAVGSSVHLHFEMFIHLCISGCRQPVATHSRCKEG